MTVTERDGVRTFEASTESSGTVWTRPQGGSGFPLLALPQTIVTIASGYRVRFRNVLVSNAGPAQWVRYGYASTKRLSGSGDYRAEAHATLIKGDSYGNEPAFSAYTRPCAGISRVNREAKTCSSPSFVTSPGEKWLVISGHSYDHGNDSPGDPEEVIAGELDRVWTASRR